MPRWFGLSSAISSVRNQQTNYDEREEEIVFGNESIILEHSKTKIITQKENINNNSIQTSFAVYFERELNVNI